MPLAGLASFFVAPLSAHQPLVSYAMGIVGIVAQADVARHGEDAQTGQVVEQISKDS